MNPLENKHIIHIRIRDLRREQELTQEELAAALGISRQSINAMEAGRCLPSLPVALQIASFFEVPLANLIQVLEEEQRAQAQRLEALLPEPSTFPLVNLHESGEHISVQFQLPGFRKEDLSIEVGETFVTVAGEVERGGGHTMRQEFEQRSFSRTISLPAAVRIDTASAEMKHGILHVTLEKVQEEKPKTARLEIKA